MAVRHTVHLVGRERHRTLEDVGLRPTSVLQNLQRQQLCDIAIALDNLQFLDILLTVQRAELHHEVIIQSVEILSQFRAFGHLLRFVAIQLLIALIDSHHCQLPCRHLRLLLLALALLLLALPLLLLLALALLVGGSKFFTLHS